MFLHGVLHQQESSPNNIFLRLSCPYQYELNPKVVDPLNCFCAKIVFSLSNFVNHCYSYSHDLNLPHSFLLLPLCQNRDLTRSDEIHP